ncbi:uncharacterized protein LOC121795835 isoform X1 [Salvia splendens]|uniref:uncharacterized protein LOC121795835 isoform X1 n=1 Tax=Salvia splendens TaxID=180675 RepID=UPI001C26C4B7|nr:uncharacterized protein LOC121795835 isoform X1 [Salvia splendens]
MADEDENSSPPRPDKPSPSPHSALNSPSMRLGDNCGNTPLLRNLQTAEEFISSVAAKIAAQPLQYSDPGVWGVLTAISEKARKRNQGMNMLLTSNEHCIGRLVDDTRFQIIAPAVSANHCKIYRKKIATGDTEQQLASCSVFLKDSSTNGTYLNSEKLNKNTFEAKLCHGDIISIAFAPHHELAFAFVYREVQKSSCLTDGGSLKRKPEEYCAENKRLKGIGIGASDGPLSLDDFRSLQRSNMELRKQLEDQVATVESLRSESRAATEKHDTEMKELKESVSKSFLDQLSQMNQFLESKDKELAELNRMSAEQKHGIEDLNERLSASMQSCTEANEIITSQKASISELKILLDEERDQRREEREKALENMKMAIQRVQAEAMEELKRVSETAMRREKEQEDVINKLQEAEKENCTLVETMRSKLEDARQKLVNSENKVRQLEGQIHQEQQASASTIKRVEELEHERKGLRKELEREKQAAREEAWSKVSALELEISAAMRDLDFERRRLKGARERIMLRETQLRAFYSTTEEISVLLVKQQEQLKAMQRTLEDEENNETTSNDIDLNPVDGNETGSLVRDKDGVFQSNGKAKTGPFLDMDQVVSSSDEASVTEKHDCNAKTQEQGEETQEVEFGGAECDDEAKGGFGSDINGIGTAPLSCGDAIGTEQIPETEGVGTPQLLEGGAAETEQVLETESLELQSGKNIDLNRCSTPDVDMMQVDNCTNEQETAEHDQNTSRSQGRHDGEDERIEDTEGGGTINTADLLASEAVGSWGCSTAPSVQGENESSPASGTKEDNECAAAAHDSSSVVAESQHIPPTKLEAAARRNHEERLALSEMIGIVAPDLREQFSRVVESDDRVGSEKGVDYNSDTEDCSDNADGGGEASDAETEGAATDVEMEGDDDTQEDSVG